MAILVAGVILVAALVVWALTRTVEPESVMSTGTSVADATTTPPLETGGLATAPVTTAPATATAMPTTTTAMPTTTATATTPPPPAVQGDRSEVRRIAVEDLRAQMNRGEVTIIDVRDAASYAASHIPGSLNIPFASIETQFDSIPKDKPIVTYCT